MANIPVNAADNNGLAPLDEAANKSHHEVVKLLLAVPNVAVNTVNNIGLTPLHYATAEEHHEVVKLLLAVRNIAIHAADSDTCFVRGSS